MLDEFPGTLISTEWHSPGYTPGDSDFEECYYYDNFGGCYGARGYLFNVGGIPHTEWNGEYDLTGGWATSEISSKDISKKSIYIFLSVIFLGAFEILPLVVASLMGLF